ncbi:hypothetical protein CYMTET_10409 [Cymbomonas tetramitiformis]|uniref:Uncharacterized protein n=1 Tax=Cymbomonas tetramitiformis TaxID=36881 RepID=A0AAE0GPT1_9CHLO|nr:hypothetical protein CYMTET_10409 [Cymbomonas tetramitiformis]
MLAHVKSVVGGEPCFGLKTDLWSPRDNKVSYSATRLSMLIESGEEGLQDVSHLVEFQRFPENRHTSAALSRHFKGVMKTRNLSFDNISLVTADGASNNKKAFKILKKRMEVCGPHQLHRSVEHGLGNAGASKNAGLQAHIKRNGSMSRSFHQSVLHSEPLEGSQRIGYVSADKETVEDAVDPDPCSDEKEGGEESEDSDVEQIEANHREGKDYPLQHRCLSAPEWSKNNQVESCLAPIHDVSVDLQAHTGAGLDMEFSLASALHQNLTAQSADVVSGADEDETWTIVHADTLPSDLKQFRKVVAEQVSERMLTLDEDTLLALKMNPSLDTSSDGVIFKEKQGSFEMMEAVYNRQLRYRGTYLLKSGLLDTQGKGAHGDNSEAQASLPSTESGGGIPAARGPQLKKRTIGQSATKFMTSSAPAATSSEFESTLNEKIRLEKETFVLKCRAAMLSGNGT